MIALVPTHYSRAIIRISDALRDYSGFIAIKHIPPMRKDSKRTSLIPGEDIGDIVVMLVNGLRDHHVELAKRCIARGQKYAVVQIALRTTRHPHTSQWRELWSRACTVWSYYPLEQWIAEDRGPEIDFPFYHAPLGVDSRVFFDRGQDRTFTICTSGQRRNQEGVAECDDAVMWAGGSIFQLGPQFPLRSHATFLTGISDTALADMYSRCQWVSGLRRHEGFELPAAEGLLCGARPILYDKLHYRTWFDGLAEFIPEKDSGDVMRHLVDLFKQGSRPVTNEEKVVAAQRFNWEKIVTGFWTKVKNG